MDKITGKKITEPFAVDIKGKKYSGYLKVRPFLEPTGFDVFIGNERIGDLSWRNNGKWRLALNEEGKKLFIELNSYQRDSIAEDLGNVVEENWNSSRWPQRVYAYKRI
jgi:hypothetical protein